MSTWSKYVARVALNITASLATVPNQVLTFNVLFELFGDIETHMEADLCHNPDRRK